MPLSRADRSADKHLEPGVIGDFKELSTGDPRNLLQQLPTRGVALAVGEIDHLDDMIFDAERRDRFGDFLRLGTLVDLVRIGHGDHHLGLLAGGLQRLGGDQHAIARRGSFRGLLEGKLRKEPIVVERERADQMRATIEKNRSDAVARTCFDEFGYNPLHGVRTADALVLEREVLRLHRAREVEDEHDIDAQRLALGETLCPPVVGRAQRRAGRARDSESPGAVARLLNEFAGWLPRAGGPMKTAPLQPERLAHAATSKRERVPARAEARARRIGRSPAPGETHSCRSGLRHVESFLHKITAA
jgi:hypothetical protein